jgi:hypothetical protein
MPAAFFCHDHNDDDAENKGWSPTSAIDIDNLRYTLNNESWPVFVLPFCPLR